VYARRFYLDLHILSPDSSPSPLERVGDRARAFASHHPPTSPVFPSNAVQSHWRDDESFAEEYSPSPTDYINVQPQNQVYYLPQGIR